MICAMMIATCLVAQDRPNLYDPGADAEKDLKTAIKKAKNEGKHVFIQVGGNWCGWCILFHQYVEDNLDIKNLVTDNYVVLKVNWSPENRNEKLMADFGHPQRFGFPVFIVLDGEGNRIHTQNSALLEEGKGYNKRHVTAFFRNWSPAAVNPTSKK